MKTNKVLTEAAELFGVPVDEKRVNAILWHLGCRTACTRCVGSGRYSWNRQDGDRCYGCNGKGTVTAKLTRTVLAEARAKVDAGELVALRAQWATLAAAKRQIRPRVASARAVYMTIATAYEAAYQVAYRGEHISQLPRDIFLAQGMNNSIMYGDMVKPTGTSVSDIERAVVGGRRTDYVAALAEIDACVAMLEALRDAWLAWSAVDSERRAA
jgi:hypothetical protein